MGGKTTKLFRTSPQPSSKAQTDNDSSYHENHINYNIQQPDDVIMKNPSSPFVYYRRGYVKKIILQYLFIFIKCIFLNHN